MDKSYHTSSESTATSNSNNNRDQYLRHLNKISHQISKPIIRKPPLDHNLNLLLQHHRPPPPAAPHQQQPPVYNINKSDFRDVVQKLTGSPAHERLSTPPPIHPPKPQSSRLHRIRPPPLAAVSNLLNAAPPPPPPANSAAVNPNFPHAAAALSPLPALPSVHGAAESPISAYMRYLQSSTPAADSDSDPKQFPVPTSPLSFGCLPSPRSAYPNMLSPSLLLSPTKGQLGFPASPRIPVPSPPWTDL